MKILFICGCLEVGKNGVGDYTRKLAAETIRLGNESTIVALMDKFVAKETQEEQNDKGITIKVFRLPLNDGIKLNGAKASVWINNNNTDWVSLQYVPFSFNKRGLHFGLSDIILKVRAKVKLHIMVHEMWVGRGVGIAFKQKILSHIQENLLKQILKSAKPNLIHTHLPIFNSNLNKLGVSTLKLPLFSNINRSVENDSEFNDNNFTIAFFSQIDTSEKVISFINEISKKIKAATERYCKLLLIGGNKDKNKIAYQVFKDKCTSIDEIICTGFLDEYEISKVISSCNLGITPIPHHALGKSGSIATFFLHGIPVAAPLCEEDYAQFGIGFFDSDLRDAILTEPDLNKFKDASIAASKAKDLIELSKVGIRFCEDLSLN